MWTGLQASLFMLQNKILKFETMEHVCRFAKFIISNNSVFVQLKKYSFILLTQVNSDAWFKSKILHLKIHELPDASQSVCW